MVISCYGCKNNAKSNSNIGYFRFPKEETRCDLWFKAVNRSRLPKHTAEFCHSTLRLCSQHFDPKDVNVNRQRKTLRLDANPVVRSLCLEEVFQNETNLEISEENIANKPSCSKQQGSDERISSEPGTSGGGYFPETNLSKSASFSKLDTSKVDLSQIDVSTETPPSLSANTPRKVGLKRKVKQLAQQIRRTERSILGGSRDSSPKPEITQQDVYNFFKENYNPNIADFINMQMNLLNKNPKGSRYSNAYKQFAMTLYFLSPKGYKFLAKTFRLPSKSTLINITKKWPINPGLNDFIFNVLQSQVANMVETSKDCVLCIDEMSLQSNFHYNIVRDELIGFHHTMDQKMFKPGNNVLVLMLRGIHSNWKQPLGYFFVNSSCPVDDLKTILFESIKKIFSVHLRLHILISDQGSNFIKLTNVLGITPENPYFYVDDFKIYYMFDVPHLLKSTRNNFFKHSLHLNDRKTSKEYLNVLYAKDKTQAYRLVPKLTDAHINPTNFQKMKVKYAAQVFSARVAAALNTYISCGVIEEGAAFTVEFIDKMDKLFDIFNSSRFKGAKFFNRAFMGASYQINFLKEMLVFFKNLKVRDNNGKEIKVKFISGWRLTISTFLNFWNDFKASGFNHVFTRRLNQDCLENFFGKVRQQNGNCRNPTPIQFLRTFKKMFVLGYFEQSEGSNCVEEFDSLLTQLTPENIKKYTIDINKTGPFEKIFLDSTDYRQLDVKQQNAFFYVGGYFLKKCLGKHSCTACKTYAKANKEISKDTLYSHFRAYKNAANDSFGNLQSPDKSFFEYFGQCENIFCKSFKDFAILPNVGKTIREQVLSIPFKHPCVNFPRDYFASLFVRTRIFYTLKFLNRDLLKGKSRCDKLNILQHL